MKPLSLFLVLFLEIKRDNPSAVSLIFGVGRRGWNVH